MQPDLFLVTVDSLRADHCGWQSETDLTPVLDELAAESVQFRNAISPGPRTPASVAASHTGSHFTENTRSIQNATDRMERIKDHVTSFETLSERLHEEGYTTVGITANPWTAKRANFDTGFDGFYEVGREGGNIHERFKRTPLEPPARLFDLWIHKDRWFTQWRTFYDRVASSIDEFDGPTFVWVFLLDCHNPYLVPREDRHDSSTLGMYSAVYRSNDVLNRSDGLSRFRNSLSDATLEKLQMAYRDTVRSTDKFIARLVSDIDDDSVLLFHADHGEAFGEHGTLGHQSVLYEENIHVPMLLYGTDAQGTVTDPVSTVGIANILASCARGDRIDPSEWTADYAISKTLDDSGIAVRGARWKYIHTETGEELFDLQADPGETTDVSDDRPAVLERLQSRATEFYDSLETTDATTEVSESEALTEHLRSLGYT